MPFVLPEYRLPHFDEPPLVTMPPVVFRPVTQRGVAPEEYHATSIFPEYYQLSKGDWRLAGGVPHGLCGDLERDGG